MMLSSESNHHILRALVAQLQPRKTLEIGLAFGGSAVEILSAVHGYGGTHTAIDPWQATVWNDEGVAAVHRSGLGDAFEFVGEGSETALPRFLSEKRRFDLIYVDGSHLFEHVIRDALYAIELLPVGGTVLFDDCRIPDIRKVLRFLSRNFTAFLHEMDLNPFRPNGSLLRRAAHRVGYCQARAFTRLRDGNRPWDARLHNF